MAASVNNPAWLEWMTALMEAGSRQTFAATLPPDRYYCLLDELPVHLLPTRFQPAAGQARDHQDQPLSVNPDCVVSPARHLPEELAPHRDLLSGFALNATIAWVRDASGFFLPFWLGPELEAVVKTLRSGERVPLSVPASTRRLLCDAGILVPEPSAHDSRTERDGLSKAALLFQERGYAPLGDLIHPFHIAALRRYYRHQIRTGSIQLGDGQSPRRYVAYNEPVARFFHQAIASQLSAVAGEALKPSYVYLASYLSGAELKKHTDREQCEFSITLCLDFSPEPRHATPWPIQLDTPTGAITVYQALGDGLAYRGTRLPHYRGKLAAGQTSTSIFFHYVAADFEGPLG
jgi:hypothetical protein